MLMQSVRIQQKYLTEKEQQIYQGTGVLTGICCLPMERHNGFQGEKGRSQYDEILGILYCT